MYCASVLVNQYHGFPIKVKWLTINFPTKEYVITYNVFSAVVLRFTTEVSLRQWETVWFHEWKFCNLNS